jgi:hypothetical protein
MPGVKDIEWFKTQLGPQIEPALAGTPLTLDFMAALACQETGEVWPVLRRKGISTAQVLALCAGDTLDADKGRKAFPRTKADLLAVSQGDLMFAIARQTLVDMAKFIPAYAGAAARPNKFCHGFGLFQRDLQFFQVDPGFFLNRTYETLPGTLAEALKELKRGLKKLGLDARPSLDDLELSAVAIVYNTGGFKPEKGLKQGHHNGTQFYGEAFFDFLRLAHAVATPGTSPALQPPVDGEAAVMPPSTVTSAGVAMRVRVSEGMLRLRSEPRISEPPQANVIGHLPDGHPVKMLDAPSGKRFVEVETSLNGALLHGFASQKFLEPDTGAPGAIVVLVPATSPPPTGIRAVHAPTKPGVIARRKAIATALSLNEPSQPARSGATAAELRESLAKIIEWLDVEDATHARYQPRAGLTFCNIYAHDFCHLAGVYLPRVWWTDKALVDLAKGGIVEPRLGATISEVVANELFAWLRDFGIEFGWRQTGTLTKLQTEVNQGAIGIIVARRKEAKRPGHIAMVVPETDSDSAKRDSSGDVSAPLQSQAGASNFRRGTGKKNWWLGEEFAEFAFWLHP